MGYSVAHYVEPLLEQRLFITTYLDLTRRIFALVRDLERVRRSFVAHRMR
jgi:hypothetical protein